MSTPPETPSRRSLAREVAGLLLVVAGVLVVLVALGAMHPVLSSSVAAAGTFTAFRFLAPPKAKISRVIASTAITVVVAATVGCAFVYFPLLGWFEVGAVICAAGMRLASEAS